MRGNTTRQIVQMLRDAGAAEIHLRISAPPIKHPCHYGIDMSSREEMIAHGRTVDEIADELGVDSLHYLSLEGVYEAVGVSREAHCDACFTGSYPLAGTEDALRQVRARALRSSGRTPRSRRAEAAGGAATVGRPMDPGEALRRLFGFEHFRPGQAEAVTAALADRDALVVMPTGSGKSLCYQLPALMRDDLTLVVSPLVSLMQDQVAALREVAPGRVELVNAQRGWAANADALERIASRARSGCCTSRPSGLPRRASPRRWRGRESGCSSSTRRTASRSGATTSAPTTSSSPTPPGASAPAPRSG